MNVIKEWTDGPTGHTFKVSYTKYEFLKIEINIFSGSL